ncbi:MAG: hypothetical protein MI923_27350 [Phycisphaerales bacterium]|nr:hypothetical protein [Phycisphaerales bacterium]
MHARFGPDLSAKNLRRMAIDNRSAQATTDPTYLSVAEVALALNQSPRHVRRLCVDRWSKQGTARHRNRKMGMS